MANNPKEVFELFDLDGSNSIDLVNFPLAFRACGLGPTNEELEKIVKEVDKNGKVSFEAFKGAVAKHQGLGKGVEDNALAAFSVFDKLDNGTVNAPEWRHVMTSIGDKLTDEEVDYMIADAQPDKDGYISYKKFVDKIK